DPDNATNYITFRRFHPLLAMLRVKYVVVVENGVMTIHPGAIPPLRRLELVGAYQIHGQRAEILRAMGEASFDPRKEVILEREPNPAPVAADTQGIARIVREGTDFVEVDADVASPSILLVTDAWARGWRVAPLEGSSQKSYELMPANYALRAVALGRGKHRLRLEYAPLAFHVGAIVSVMAWATWIVAAVLLWRHERRLAGPGPYLAVIDADLQHDETLVPQLLAKARREEADVAVASRYMAGGSTGELAPKRVRLSRLAATLSATLCEGLTDPTSGFFVVRRTFLDRVVRNLYGRGFKILLDLIAAARGKIR